MKKIVLDDSQQALVSNNYRLLERYISKLMEKYPHLQEHEEEIKSELNYRFCVSAYYYDSKTGFSFSNFAFGGFAFGMQKLFGEKNNVTARQIRTYGLKPIEMEEKKVESDFLYDLIDSAKLTKVEKELLEDYYSGGLSYSEIGEKHKMNREKIRRTVCKIIYRMKY